MKTIDNILNKITMYRVVLYELIFLLVVANIFGFLGMLPYTPINLLFSVVFITAACWIVNQLFAWAYDAPSNPESSYITALILVLIITPATSFGDVVFLTLAFWASSLAIASKYILAIGKKHIFNPAAIAVVITALILNQSASWWLGTAVMLPFVTLGGFLVVRKIKRTDLVWAFVMSALATILVLSAMNGGNIVVVAERIILSTPLFFFASVMLTEPLTAPPTVTLQVIYGLIVGILFSPAIHVGSIYSTPELALVVGNVFAYIVSPKKKLVLVLKEIKQVTVDTYDFLFTQHQNGGGFISDKSLSFRPGQYMEWTLDQSWPDSRGMRRYFTLASSPTERELRLGVKFYPEGSSFKKKLLTMKKGDSIVASGLAGDFVLPKDKEKKLVFIAGGIGITPFRSMIQYLIDNKEPRDIILLYSNKTVQDIAYEDVFDKAEETLGIKTLYAITNPNAYIPSIPNVVRTIDARTISEKIPDYKERTFYLSGPHGMVTAFNDSLRSMGVKKDYIKKDFFPGFA